MKGIHPLKNGKWRVNIMVNRERMTKVCYSLKDAVQTAAHIRLFLNLKYKDTQGSIMYTVNQKGQIMENVSRPVTQPQTSGAVQMFTFPATGQGVRIIEKDGQPWFVSKDVCDVLGLDNNREAVSGLDSDEKITVRNPDGNPRNGIPHQMTIISESGLYALIFRSNKPEARVFSKWVRAEVLPAIRRTGGYIIAQPEETPEIIMARALFVAKDALDRTQAQLAEAQPKVEAYDVLLNTTGTFTLTETAKHFEMSARRLNAILREEKWMFKRENNRKSDTYKPHLPYQSIIERGYAVIKTRSIPSGQSFVQAYITPRGLAAIERMLRKRCDI